MKKLLIGCLILLTACQPAISTPVPVLLPTSTLAALPVPVMLIPDSTFTPKPSPTPLPRFFTTEFDSPLAGWVTLQAGNTSTPNIKTEDSHLILQMDSSYSWLYVLYGAQDYSDVQVVAQFENRAGTPSSIGMICRYTAENGWYEFNISTDGTYNVLYGRWLTVGVADYLPILSASSRDIKPSGESQQIGLTCSDITLGLTINEKLVRNVDVSRYGLTEGKVGVTASSFENTPISAVFDWVEVSEP